MLKTSTFHFCHGTCYRAACGNAVQDPCQFSMSCPIIFAALVWPCCPFNFSIAFCPRSRFHTAAPDGPALIGRAWKTFRPGHGSGKAPIVWMVGLPLRQSNQQKDLALIAGKKSCVDALKGKPLSTPRSFTTVHLNFTLTRHGGRGKLCPPGLAASSS